MPSGQGALSVVPQRIEGAPSSPGGLASWHLPPRQLGAESGSHTSTPGQEGSAGQSRPSSYSASLPAGTAVSEPPRAQPQQSAGTWTQSSSPSHSGASLPRSQASSRQPKSSRAKPFSHAISVTSGEQTSWQRPSTQAGSVAAQPVGAGSQVTSEQASS